MKFSDCKKLGKGWLNRKSIWGFLKVKTTLYGTVRVDFSKPIECTTTKNWEVEKGPAGR